MKNHYIVHFILYQDILENIACLFPDHYEYRITSLRRMEEIIACRVRKYDEDYPIHSGKIFLNIRKIAKNHQKTQYIKQDKAFTSEK